MPSEHLHVDRDGDIAVITVDRQERRNAMHGPLWTAIREAGEALAAEPPRAVILTGAGPHFCAGMDLRPDNPLIMRLAPAVMGRDTDAMRALIGDLKACMNAIATLPCPVIAAVEGACLGGGLELALTADLRIAGTSARFTLPETRWGMVPDVGGTVRLSRLVGASRATDVILTGRQVLADEALAWGLVNRVVPDGQALAAAHDMVHQILRGSPAGTSAILPVLRRVQTLDDPEAFAAETEAGVQTLTSGEVMEGVAAFAQKRSPGWAP